MDARCFRMYGGIFGKTISLTLLLIFFIYCPQSANAADEGLNLVTSPLPISLVVVPGTSVSTPIKIKNGGVSSERIKVSVMKFKAYESNGQPQLLDPEPGDDFVNWVSFSENEFLAEPNEWKTITAAFDVPEDAAFGYYYALVFGRADEKINPESKQTAVVGGTAVLVLLEARVDSAKRSVEVAEFSTDKSVYEFLPTTFSVKLKNTGNVHVAPRGNIFINKGDEHDIAILELNANKGSILPDSSRNFEEKWIDGFPVYGEVQKDKKVVLDEKGNQVLALQWDWSQASKLRFGKHTAKLLLIYDDGKKDIPVEGEVSFWVLPWRLVGGLLLAALLIGVGLKNTLQNIWKRITGQSKKEK